MMTNQQLKVAIAIAELGSISAASKALSVSQPNASGSIRLLEEEIGFHIFARGKGGALLTKKGELFLEHARQVVSESDKILAIAGATDPYRLRLGTVNYYAAIEPFLTLCALHRQDVETDFRCYSVSVADGIEQLLKRSLDVVVAPVLLHQVTGLMTECKRGKIRAESICRIPAVIIVRKGHPAIADGRLNNITQGSDAMKDYPYVSYRNLFEDAGSTGYDDSDFIQSSCRMIVDEVDVRLRLVAKTDAFMFGVRSARGMMDRYGLVAFPVPGISLEMFALTRSVEEKSHEITEYLELLKREMAGVLR